MGSFDNNNKKRNRIAEKNWFEVDGRDHGEDPPHTDRPRYREDDQNYYKFKKNIESTLGEKMP